MKAAEAHGQRTPAVSPARALAVRILAGRSREIEGTLRKALTKTSLLAEDRRLTSEIVLGTTSVMDEHSLPAGAMDPVPTALPPLPTALDDLLQ